MKVPIRTTSYRNNPIEDKIEYANFNQTRIITLFQVPHYDHLQILICNGNSLTTLAGIETIKHLWKLDVGNNQIRSLQHLSRFIALGSLILSNNKLSWIELQHIRHMSILDFRIDGNPILDQDPNYRQHVLDCLPRIWMCDGVFVSTVERNQVDDFFTQSSLTAKPVRRKLAKDIFMPTNLKDRTVNGLFGTKATELFAKFPMNCFITPELDRKRIKHLATTTQEILLTEMKYANEEKKLDPFLNENRHLFNQIVDLRQTHVEQFNMFLILLMTDILYRIPENLLEPVLNLTHIKNIGNLNIPHLFTCSEQLKCTLASLVYAGARVDRDENHPSAIYDKLFQSLSIVLTSEVRQLSSQTVSTTFPNTALLSESKSMLCLEVMQVFVMCPQFYTLANDSNVSAIIKQALDRSPAYESVRNVLENLQTDEKTAEEKRDLLSPTMSNILKMAIRTLSSKRTKKLYESVVIMPEVNVSESDHSAPSHHPEPEPTPRKLSSRAAMHRSPAIGDRILTAPQSFGRIVTLPDSELAMVQLDHVLAVNGSMISNGTLSDHTVYVTMNNFEWNPTHEYWRPKSTQGDRVTLQMTTARMETPRLQIPAQSQSIPSPVPSVKALPRRTSELTIRRSISTPKRVETSVIRPKEAFVDIPRPATPASPPPRTPPQAAPVPSETDGQTNSQLLLPKSPPPTPPSIDQRISVIKERSRERPMSVRIIKQKQDRSNRDPTNGESFTSAPVLIESMLLLMPDQSQVPLVSFEQVQPSVQSTTTITDLEAIRAASLLESSTAAVPSLLTSDRQSNIPRVHVPVHNASQWFNGPDLQNERLGRMEKVVASLVRRPFRATPTYGMPRVPTLSSPSSKDHAYYRGVRPESFQEFRVETQRLTPVPTSSSRLSPPSKGRYSTSPIHNYSSNRLHETYYQSVTRVKSLLNPPRSTPTTYM